MARLHFLVPLTFLVKNTSPSYPAARARCGDGALAVARRRGGVATITRPLNSQSCGEDYITYQRMQKKWQMEPASTKRCQIGW